MILEIEISTHFKDQFGNEKDDELFLPIENDKPETDVMTEVNDLVNEWFYSVADDFCLTIWKEEGGGTDYEYEYFFENYLKNCSLNWNYKKS